jgi:Tol biopolymer transport system component
MTPRNDVLDRLAPLFEPAEHPFESFLRRRDRRRRARTVGALVLAAAVLAAFAASGLRLLGHEGSSPATPPGPFGATRGWITASDGGVVAVDPAPGGGSREVRLTSPPEGSVDGPVSWSADGSTLLFVRYGGDANGSGVRHGELFVARAEGPVRRVRTDGATWGSLSPGGSRLAFGARARSAGSGEGLWVVGTEGGEPDLLLAERGAVRWPAWSPDGTTIAFVGAHGVHLVAADGSNDRVIVRPSGTEMSGVSGLAWSPDGRRLALIGEGDCGTFACYQSSRPTSQLFVVDADGRNLEQLTHGAGAFWCPSWSPDGSRVAFLGDNGKRLMAIAADGSSEAPTTLRPVPYEYGMCGVAWEPDPAP